jgi:hypothetical protein
MPSTPDEESLVAQGRGKWSLDGVPRRGWRCVGIEDSEQLSTVCEMCESQVIRYLHFMQHTAYQGDLVGARERDKLMTSRTNKRKRWLTRRWRISARGNEWITSDGFRVTVYARGARWGVTVAAVDDDDQVTHDWRTYPSSDAAKLAGFDFVSRKLAQNATAI